LTQQGIIAKVPSGKRIGVRQAPGETLMSIEIEGTGPLHQSGFAFDVIDRINTVLFWVAITAIRAFQFARNCFRKEAATVGSRLVGRDASKD
jgi:hypothetical protein